ncbi:DUF179-domain-containing protein [Coccomyxa subellipsoidea C-169]|uniref:DUF179-domain-containing protein n=1 Tax=Coccomyxa subellipsoidea (strain C-169) TaxID=574566 RepID=I0YXN7_COCSC|nr:DUF179-domain-containing protein [Coccomyxa subellipsoidea C-169]EIE23156.1 DUF179-domain-containing protein [Coccomyxa subellipsoidea C-169]|eukprot:XP_005647700.1 DUF179-domain-containing protein [Coccomyxa subellipsoidea C-169]
MGQSLVAGTEVHKVAPLHRESRRKGVSEKSTEPDEESKLWAHSINFPEKGCLLIAHPLVFTTQQQYFAQAVIFIFEHSEQGSAGLILNKPTQYTIGTMSGLEALCPEFNNNGLFLGGDVSPNSMHMLHCHGQLPEAVEIIRGINMGGFDAAKAAVSQGRMPATDFKWFTRYSGWGAGQLQRECASGVWFTAAASSALVLQQGCADSADSGREMWHQVLNLIGGDLAELSKAQKGVFDPEIMGTPAPPSENRDGDAV